MPVKNVLLVDQSIPDYQVFLDSVNDFTCAVLYSDKTSKDVLYRMIHEKTESAERLAIVSLKDNLFVDMTPISQSKDVFASLVSEHRIKRIDFLACNTLEDTDYKALYEALESETGVVVGASSDLTGNVRYGGDWVMENTKEDIQRVYFTDAIENYQYLLDSQETLLYVKNDILYALGNNNPGQAGLSTPTSILTPTQVPLLDSSGNSLVSMIKQISYGASHTFILLTNGTLWGSGLNTSGQLGLGNNTTRYAFTKVDVSNVVQVSCGRFYTMIVKSDGTLWGTGYNLEGQLGTGQYAQFSSIGNLNVFTQVNISDVVQVSAANIHTVALKKDGTLWGTGYRYWIGLTSIYSDYVNSFTQLNISDVEKVSSGWNHTTVLKRDGTLWGTGGNTSGQLGMNDYLNKLDSFIQVDISNVEDVFCGANHVAILKGGTVWTTGFNGNGQLGLNSTTAYFSIFTNTNKTAKTVNCGRRCTILVDNNYTLWGAGDSSAGLLATTGNQTTFVTIATLITSRFPSRLTNFSIPTQTDLTTRTISLTNPTSNSTGTITYVSTNPTVATVTSGSLNILTGGKTVLYVSQPFTTTYDESFLFYEVNTNYLFTPTVLSNFSIPVTTSRTIQITPPTSNRVGGFTYTSSRPNIASVTGNVITVKSKGVAIITAYQSGTSLYQEAMISTTIDTSSLFVNDVYQTVVSSTSVTLPTDQSSYLKVTGDEGKIDRTLATPFVFRGVEETKLTIDMNSSIYLGTTVSSQRNALYPSVGLSSYNVPVIHPFYTNLSTSSSLVSKYILYKENSDSVTIFFNAAFSGDLSNTTSQVIIKITLFLKNSANSGNILIEYGSIIASNSSITNVASSMPNGFLSGITFAPYDTTSTFTTDDWFTQNLQKDINTPNVRYYPFTQEQLTAISNKSITYVPSKRKTIPMLQSLIVPSNSTSRRILLTAPVSTSPAPFTYTTSNSSATIDGNYLVLTNKLPVTLTATQSANGQYDSASISVTLDTSYFTNIADIVVPTLQPWSILSNSTSRVIRLTPPVSNSPGPFTYTTSNPLVATIENGRCLLIYKPESVTVTASQPAAEGTSVYYEAASTTLNLDPSYFTFMTDICFPAGTPILTDQGTFPIETLTNQTLGGKPILHITKTLGTEEQLVCFEKDALGKDQPSQKTVMTIKHRLEKDGKIVKASECVNGESIHMEWYMGEYLYNVLLSEQSLMNVNGILCETLDPENDVAKFYSA